MNKFRNELAEKGIELTVGQIESLLSDLKKACDNVDPTDLRKEDAIYQMAEMGIEVSPDEYDSLIELVSIMQNLE